MTEQQARKLVTTLVQTEDRLYAATQGVRACDLAHNGVYTSERDAVLRLLDETRDERIANRLGLFLRRDE